jgi:hypothetical protein
MVAESFVKPGLVNLQMKRQSGNPQPAEKRRPQSFIYNRLQAHKMPKPSCT